MRQSQKSNRARNKNGRKPNAPSVNRVYESSGPEGKVRGTPQQIIEKYQSLSRDKATSGDRVMAENFLQHAEHYMRILLAAQGAQQQQQQQRRDEREDDLDFDGDEGDFEPMSPQGGARNGAGSGQGAGSGAGPVADSLAVIGDDGVASEIVPTPESFSSDARRPQQRRREPGEGGEDGEPTRRRPRRSGRRPQRGDDERSAESGESERSGGDGEASFDGPGRPSGGTEDAGWSGDEGSEPATVAG